MKKYVALIGFSDRATGQYIVPGSPYPPGDRVVSQQWVEYLLGSGNATGAPVIKEKGRKQKPKPASVELAEQTEPTSPIVVEEITPLIEGAPIEKAEEPVPVIPEVAEPPKPVEKIPNPFVPPAPKRQDDPFEGLTEQGVYEVFKILSNKVRFLSYPETKEEYLAFLKEDDWKGENMRWKKKLLTAFGVSGASKFTPGAVDSTIKDILTRAVNAKVKG